MIHATIKVLGKIYKAKGETVQEAIGNLKPGIAKGTSVLTLTKGDKTIEKIFPARITQNLFSLSPTMRSVHLKQIAMRFDI